jgi:hypothetical protein
VKIVTSKIGHFENTEIETLQGRDNGHTCNLKTISEVGFWEVVGDCKHGQTKP